MVFQEKENIEDFLEEKNSSLNRELLELYGKIVTDDIELDPLVTMNEAWYIAKWVFMQKEPKVLLFNRELRTYIEDETMEYACLLAYYILKRQQTLPDRISEFLPEMEKLFQSYWRVNHDYIPGFDFSPYEEAITFLNSHTDVVYNTNLYLEINYYKPTDISKATNGFKMEDIKRILPYYGNIDNQLAFIHCVEKSMEKIAPPAPSTSTDDLPF
jgi:hypothetical protein